MTAEEFNKELTNRMLVVDKELRDLNKKIREIKQEKINLQPSIENVYDKERGMKIHRLIQKDEELNNEGEELNNKKNALDIEILKFQSSSNPDYATLELLVSKAEDILKKQKQVITEIEKGISEVREIIKK